MERSCEIFFPRRWAFKRVFRWMDRRFFNWSRISSIAMRGPQAGRFVFESCVVESEYCE